MVVKLHINENKKPVSFDSFEYLPIISTLNINRNSINDVVIITHLYANFSGLGQLNY